MKKFTPVFFLFVIALLAMPFSAIAKQRYDFSDVEQPFLTLPFNVVNVDVSGEAPKVSHNYHLAEPYDAVIQKLADMYDQKKALSEFFIMGMTKQSDRQMYQVIIAFQNEHHYVQVTPEGAGTLFSVDATPVSYVTGVYPIAVYGFTMPDGNSVAAEKFTEE